jgi:uncharacterized membrane protein YhaH (DUF805 family)
MAGNKPKSARRDPSLLPIMRSFGLEMLLYLPPAIIYLALLLRFATGPLRRLSETDPTIYALLCLIVIVGQGVLLEIFTSWLLRRIGLRH